MCESMKPVFNKYVLSTFYMPSWEPDTTVNKTEKSLRFWRAGSDINRHVRRASEERRDGQHRGRDAEAHFIRVLMGAPVISSV